MKLDSEFPISTPGHSDEGYIGDAISTGVLCERQSVTRGRVTVLPWPFAVKWSDPN